MREDDGWAVGAAQFSPSHPHEAGKLVVAVRCRLGSLSVEEYALLDTGAQWSVVGSDLAKALEGDFAEGGQPIRMSTRHGILEGVLRRLPVTLVADEGAELSVEATVFVADQWPGPVVVGYGGLLERVRFALDPGATGEDCWFYFGEPASTFGPDSRLLP